MVTLRPKTSLVAYQTRLESYGKEFERGIESGYAPNFGFAHIDYNQLGDGLKYFAN